MVRLVTFSVFVVHLVGMADGLRCTTGRLLSVAAAISDSVRMQQHSGGARQRHRMQDRAMERLTQQRCIRGGAKAPTEAAPRHPAATSPSSRSIEERSRQRALRPLKQKAVNVGIQVSKKWQRTGDRTVQVDVAVVEELLESRMEARARRDYSLADDLREELWREHGVSIFDNELAWTAVKRC